MCGIVVGLAFGKLNARKEKIRQHLLKYFTTELLLQTETRGKDATGAAILFEDGNYVGVKRGETVSEFLAKFGTSKEYYGGLLKVWDKAESNVKVYLGHCRAGTTGHKTDNNNNHPIKIGNIVGIHNGVIRNHEEIFKRLDCSRDGEVDSEAIFRLFSHFTNSGKEPFTLDLIQEVVHRLDGQFAITLFNADNPFQIPFFRDGRPVEFVLLREYGILLAISELKFWKRVFYNYARVVYYYNFFLKQKLPSFIGEDQILTSTLEDDSAIIFDLTKNVNQETVIKDLGDWRKMKRNKIWPAKTVTRYAKTTYYSRGYSGYSSHKATEKKPTVTPSTATPSTKTVDIRKGKRRIFDPILKKYKIKDYDRDLKENESIDITADLHETTPNTNKALEIVSRKTGKPIDKVISTDKPSNNLFIEDDQGEVRGVTAEILDSTHYNHQDGETNNISGSKDSNEDDKKEVVDVTMKVIPPAIADIANKAYKALPIEEKGYTDVDQLLNDIAIESVEVAKILGLTIIANRVAKSNWIQGYTACLMDQHIKRSKNSNNKTDKISKEEEKARRREQHIQQLKTLVTLLCVGYDTSDYFAAKNRFRHNLRKLHKDVGLTINMENLNSMFNKNSIDKVDKVLTLVKEISSK